MALNQRPLRLEYRASGKKALCIEPPQSKWSMTEVVGKECG
jgi:hypothetical protein